MIPDAASQPVHDTSRAIDLFRQMVRIRRFETAAVECLARGEIFGSIHSSIGQEAVAVGVCANLGPEDVITSTHRGHHHVLAKGADPNRMMAELFGRRTGTNIGRGGSMHIADFAAGVLGANGIVGGGLSIAVGAAHGLRVAGTPGVVVCFFGDGATNRGPFLEALNWASLFRLPVLFVCEDNDFAAYTSGPSMIAGAGPSARARALGVAACEADGSDVLAIDMAASVALMACRNGEGPRFLLVTTSRLAGHTIGDDESYRPRADVADKWRGDPIEVMSRRLLASGVAQDELLGIETAAAEEIGRAVRFARGSPWPDGSDLLMNVQQTGAPSWHA